MSSTTSLEDNLAAADAADSAYVIVIRDHVNSPYDSGMIREVIGPFFEMSDAQSELNKMIGHDGHEPEPHRYRNGGASRDNTHYWNAAQGLCVDNSFSFTISKTILASNSRWTGRIIPWTEREKPPYWDHEEEN